MSSVCSQEVTACFMSVFDVNFVRTVCFLSVHRNGSHWAWYCQLDLWQVTVLMAAWRLWTTLSSVLISCSVISKFLDPLKRSWLADIFQWTLMWNQLPFSGFGHLTSVSSSQDSSCGAAVVQVFQCQYLLCAGLMSSICYPRITVRIKFLWSECFFTLCFETICLKEEPVFKSNCLLWIKKYDVN